MRFARNNRWDVQVAFKGWRSFGVKNLSAKQVGHEITADTVIAELSDFLKHAKAARVVYRKRLREIATDPVLAAKAKKLGIL